MGIAWRIWLVLVLIQLIGLLRCSSASRFSAMFSFLVIARRLEKEVKQVLDEISHDQAAKERLIRGRQVDLAEELSE